MNELKPVMSFALMAVCVICCMVGGCLFAEPQYRVWQQGMSGQARLKEAESSKQIATLEAKAKLESAKMLADAEIERAKGVAEANRIIGEGLKGHEEYLMYLWVQSLSDKENHVIYIPTEANIPIMEYGPSHIVWEDENFNDSSIDFCLTACDRPEEYEGMSQADIHGLFL